MSNLEIRECATSLTFVCNKFVRPIQFENKFHGVVIK